MNMNTFELIEHLLQLGLITFEVAQTLRNYIQKKNGQSQDYDTLREVLEEMLQYLKAQNSQANEKEPFSNVGWLNHFIDATQNIHDTSIQALCDRIMAQELVSPGITPQRITNILSVISFEDLQKFQIVCSMNIRIITDYDDDSSYGPIIDKYIMFPFDDSDDREKINFELMDIYELQALGLLTYNDSGSYVVTGYPCKHPLIYANGKTFYILWHPKDVIPVGKILLTKAGNCISNVLNECEITNDYAEDVRTFMEFHDVAFAEQKRYSIYKSDKEFLLATEKNKRTKSR